MKIVGKAALLLMSAAVAMTFLLIPSVARANFTNYEVVFKSVSVPGSASDDTVEATCTSSTKRVIGGGYDVTGLSGAITITGSVPVDGGGTSVSGWEVSFNNADSTSHAVSMWAICADVS